jgi:hypothetical protein
MAVGFAMLAVCKCRISLQPEFFTKIGMPARFPGQSFSIFPGVARSLNGVDDPRVTRTPAKMAREALLDGFAVICAALPQERRRPNNDSRNAEAALDATLEREGFTQHLPHLFRKALKRHYVVAFHLFWFAQARQDRLTIHQDRAAAAGALWSAPILGGNDAALLAQDIEKLHAWLVRNRCWLSV